MARRSDSAAPATRHPSQLLALAIGAVYTLVGILGFLVTGFENFAAETDKTLLGFEINPLHNLVHLAIGLAGLALWRRLDTARTYGWLLAAGYGLAFIYGLFAAGNSDINFLSLNGADNGLHLVSAVAGLAIALLPADRTVPPTGWGRRPWRLTRATSGGEPAQQPWSAHLAPLRTPLDVAAA
jgi:hypothetical protein